MSDSLKITLGGQEFEVRTLTLRQARQLGIGMMQDRGTSFESNVDQAIDVVVVALAKSHEMTADKLLDMEGVTPRDIVEASAKIMAFAGFVAKKSSLNGAAENPGEAQPGAA